MEWKFFWAKTFIDFLNLFHFSLTTTNESLEEKCEELRRQIEDLHREVEIERRKNERLQLEQRTKKEESVTTPINMSSSQPDVCFCIAKKFKLAKNVFCYVDNHAKLIFYVYF